MRTATDVDATQPDAPLKGRVGKRWLGHIREPLAAALRLTALLVVVAFGFQAVLAPPLSADWSLWRIMERVMRVTAQLLPFAAFVCGVTTVDRRLEVGTRPLTTMISGVIVGVLAYALYAVVVPVAEYATLAEAGHEIETIYPFGAETPAGLLQHRAFLSENPPEVLSFSTDRPLDRPLSWITFLLVVPLAHGVFAVLNALIGHSTARLTAAASAVRRRHIRWTVALIGGVAYVLVLLALSTVLRTYPDMPGALAGGLPLLIPITQLAYLYAHATRLTSTHPEGASLPA